MRLRLRPLEFTDAAPTASLIVPAVSRWTATWPETISPKQVAERIVWIREQDALGLAMVRAIERVDDRTLLGWIGLYRATASARKAGLSFWLGEPFHGHGYMTEAAMAFIALAWSSCDVDVIEAGAQPENAASIAILRRLGMRYVGGRREFAPNRDRDELCAYFEVSRSS